MLVRTLAAWGVYKFGDIVDLPVTLAAARIAAGLADIPPGEAVDNAQRVRLTGTLVLWVVGTTGSDATTDGTTYQTAFQTVQAAVNAVYARYDTNGYNVQIQLNQPAGPYTAPITISGRMPGGGDLILYGTGGTGIASIVVANANAITVQSGARVQLQNLNISTTGTGASAGVLIGQRGFVSLNTGLTFGACTGARIDNANGTLFFNARIAATGDAVATLHNRNKSMMVMDGFGVDLVGNPNHSAYLFGAAEGSSLSAIGATITGTATGLRFFIHYGATVRTSNLGLASILFFPGSFPGVLQRGGVLDNLGAGQIMSVVQITASTSLVFPVNGCLSAITIANTSAIAAAGGISIGTTALGVDVVNAEASAGNSLVKATIAPGKSTFSAVADQTLFITVPAGGAVITVCLYYDAAAPPV